MNTNLTLKDLRNSKFPFEYKKFLVSPESVDYNEILTLAILLINSDDMRVQKLGYSIIMQYCNNTGDYLPLYEIAMNIGLYPISKLISTAARNKFEKDSFFLEINDAFMEHYKINEHYRSLGQKLLYDYFINNINANLTIVAPTSYGKTELIITLLKHYYKKNICIITPTKSLLAQTKQRILEAKISYISKIITHPEMFTGKEPNIIAVLTQERLLRLLKKSSSLNFDYLIVDEAHSLLRNDKRNILLASVILMLVKSNPIMVIKYLTPFLNNKQNINLRFCNIKPKDYHVIEYIKSEKFYLYDPLKQSLELYDQYMDKFYTIPLNSSSDSVGFIENMKSKKNIVYLNKPADIEDFAGKLSDKHDEILNSKINRACKDIGEYLHPEYNLLTYLRKGIIYHHGSVPDTIRLYIEKLYSEIAEIEFVITNSTLLEGVNLPAERMFILDYNKGKSRLSQANFKNLIGRVCRFNDIFKNNSTLEQLSPHIYLIKSKYCRKNANLHNFLSERANELKDIEEDSNNVLLQSTEITNSNRDDYNSSIEFIENYGFKNLDKNIKSRHATTKVGKTCFLNNINELPIFDIENDIQDKVNQLHKKKTVIDDPSTLIKIIVTLFISYIPEDSPHQNLRRLINLEAQKFYTMFLNWRINCTSYSKMINSFLDYWNSEEIDIIYVGRWGDLKWKGRRPIWTNIKAKSINERVNLAIVRIKEEQDFLDNVIIKYIEMLNDLELIKESFYLKIKYGTSDKRIITLVKNGISLSLSKLIIEKYLEYITLNIEDSTVNFDREICSAMILNGENEVLINELSYFVR